MRYFLAHLDDRPAQAWETSDPAEEIYVIPFGQSVATAVPVGALRHLLAVLTAATADLPEACCPGCGARLPAKAR